MAEGPPDRTAAVRAEGEGRDPFEWLVLAVLTLLAFSVLAGLGLRTLLKGGVVTGADGFLVVDPMQYLNWLRQAGAHGAVANLYDFGPLRYTFVHPGLLVAGLFHRLGAGLVVSYALIKPVAIGLLFLGVSALVHRHFEGRADRRFALVLALFFCAPAAAVAGWSLEPWAQAKFELDFAGGETWIGSYLWGYVFTGCAVGIVPLGVLAWERARQGGRGALAAAAASALFAGWLQPWQGATLLALLAATELVILRGRWDEAPRSAVRLLPVLLAGVAPLVYYLVLSRTDPAWELAGRANDLPRWSWWVLPATLAPIVIPAAWAWRPGGDRWSDAGKVALRLWPLAAIGVYLAPLGTFPFHALQGIQFPLAILAVQAVRDLVGDRRRRLWLAVAVGSCGLLIVPGTAYRVQQMGDAVSAGLQPFFLTADEREALRWIEASREQGGVITENYLGTVIPAYTGRQTWLGAGSWTPDFASRQKALDQLFAGKLGPLAARRLVVRQGAGFILEDCRAKPRFFRDVSGFTRVVWRRGCVTVLRVDGAPR